MLASKQGFQLLSMVDGTEMEQQWEQDCTAQKSKGSEAASSAVTWLLHSGREAMAALATAAVSLPVAVRRVGLLLHLLVFLSVISWLVSSRTPAEATATLSGAPLPQSSPPTDITHPSAASPSAAQSPVESVSPISLVSDERVWSHRLCAPLSPTFPHVHIRVNTRLVALYVFATVWDDTAQEWRLLAHIQPLEGEHMEASRHATAESEGLMAALVADGAMQCIERDTQGGLTGRRSRAAFEMEHWSMAIRCTFAQKPRDASSIRLHLTHPLFIEPLQAADVARVQSGNSSVVTQHSPLVVDVCRHSDRPVKISHCSMPNDGDTYRYQLLHYIHHHTYLGIERFYVMDETGRLQSVLQPYIDSGLVDYQYFFPLTPQLAKADFFWDQQLLMETCRYKARASSEWITNLDLDEWVSIPASSWLEPAAALSLTVRPNHAHFPELYPTLVSLLLHEQQQSRCATEADFVKPAARVGLGAIRNLTRQYCTGSGAGSLSALGLFLDVVTDPAARDFLASWNATTSWASVCSTACKDAGWESLLSAVVTLSWVVQDEASSRLPELNSSLSTPLPLLFPSAYVPLQPNATRIDRHKVFIRPSIPATWVVHGLGLHNELLPFLERPLAELHFQHFWRAAVPDRPHTQVVAADDLLVDNKQAYHDLLHTVYNVTEMHWAAAPQ